MPPSKRRRTGGAAVVPKQQRTLSFRSTKAGATETELPGKTAAKPETTKHTIRSAEQESKPQVVDVTVEDIEPQHEQPETSTIEDESIAQEPEPEELEDQDEDLNAKAAAQVELDKKALAISDIKIKSYWAAKERERKAPRVHQEDLTVREKVLREWDMSTRYGPGIGIPRLARWRRAYDLGMNPPIEVLSVLLKAQESSTGKNDADKSIMDELTMSSRLRGDTLLEA